jgi:FKBP-type peptidyl-prolyl cis-trans isomerase
VTTFLAATLIVIATAGCEARAREAAGDSASHRRVIAGVDEGVTGMRVGERRTLVVPPSLDGRTYDPALIPAGSTLYYDSALIAIVT